MTSLLTRSIILFICLVTMTQCRYNDLPICFTDFTALLNGNLDNIDQVKDGKGDRIQLKGKPVLIPGLQKDPVLYVEESINGSLYRRIIFMRNESSTDQTLNVTYYNFTEPGYYKPGTFNTDSLANYTREDFRLDEGCKQSYTKLSPGVLLGESLDCRHSVNGEHPIYTIVLTCDSLRLQPPLAADETTSLETYVAKNMGPRYSLIDPPEGYINPCQDGL